MFRTVLRTLGLLASLGSFATLMTTRGPSGEPSVIERVPALMDALKARVAARESGASETGTGAESAPWVTADQAPPVVPGASTDPLVAVAPAPLDEDVQSPDGLAQRLPSGSGRVKVNRGLP